MPRLLTRPHLLPKGLTMELIVPAVELRAWARASQLLAEREGFTRTAKAIQAYIDDIEAHMHDGAHSFELRSITNVVFS